MKKIILLCLLLAPAIIYGQDYDAAMRAIDSGDFPAALKELQPLSEQGDARAQGFLGTMYAEGIGVRQDAKAAIKWLSLSANQGSADAQYSLGTVYYKGAIVTKSDQEAAKWWLTAAEQGDVNAQLAMASMYVAGSGVVKDDQEAAKWFREAADQGSAAGQYAVGHMYFAGTLVPKNDKEAHSWWLKSAEQGNVNAQTAVGTMYSQGLGLERDEKEAIKWYRKAADQGNAYAQSEVEKYDERVEDSRLRAAAESRRLNQLKAEREWDEAQAQCFNDGPQRYAQGVLREARQLLGAARAKGAICSSMVDGWYNTYFRWKDQHRSFTSMMLGPADSAWCSAGVASKQEVNLWKIQMPSRCR